MALTELQQVMAGLKSHARLDCISNGRPLSIEVIQERKALEQQARTLGASDEQIEVALHLNRIQALPLQLLSLLISPVDSN